MKLQRLSDLANFLPKLKPRAKKNPDRPFDAAQIEVTSRCSTGCLFCPHDALSAEWVEGDMPLELYREHIAPHLDMFKLVYLQGWGEPMLHPHLWDMLDLARQKGCRTGFTTNGYCLQGEQNNKLLDMGVDLISVSFAGTGAAIHESLRTHSDFSRLCANFESLANLKHQRGLSRPWLELHFLMTHANLSELPLLVELAARLGADEVVATNLAYSPSPALDRMHVFGEQPLPEDLEILARAQAAAKRLNIPLRAYPLQTELDTLVCDAEPLDTIYINHKGDVSPCVYLGLTVQGRIPRFYLGEPHPFEMLSFGNVCNGLIQAIQSSERRKFVEVFKRRSVSNNPLALFTYMAGQGQASELPFPPAPCRYCYKMLGI